ncbi:DUF6636 domain-containing protein [Mycobacterium antarcticum]
MRSRRSLLPLVVAGAVLCACGGQGAGSASTTGSPTRSTPMVQRTPDKAVATTEPEAIADLVGFTSPSGNVGCYLDPTTVRCDISERDWSPPPRPADCEFDYGQGIALTAGERPAFVCAGDTALGGGAPLPYGQSVAAGSLRCDSAESGITCIDSATNHGFSIARERYEMF